MDMSFATSPADFQAIGKIVDRVWSTPALRRLYRSRMDAHMDLSAVHANGNPLRFGDLLAADDFSFAHDIGGISRFLDRDTGRLTNCFSPRFSARDLAAA